MEEETKSPKPLVLQSGREMLDTVVGEKAADATMASGSEWVKAVTQGRLPSRRSNGR